MTTARPDLWVKSQEQVLSTAECGLNTKQTNKGKKKGKKGRLCHHLQKDSSSSLWSATEQKEICKLHFFLLVMCLKKGAKHKYLDSHNLLEIFFPCPGKPSTFVGVSPMEQNVWEPFKWLFDDLIKKNASSHHTPPTVDKWCHLLWKYFTKHCGLESVSNSDF